MVSFIIVLFHVEMGNPYGYAIAIAMIQKYPESVPAFEASVLTWYEMEGPLNLKRKQASGQRFQVAMGPEQKTKKKLIVTLCNS